MITFITNSTDIVHTFFCFLIYDYFNISKIHLPLKSSPNVDIGQNFCRSSDDTGNDADLMLNFVNQRFDRCRFIGQRQVDERLLHTGQHGRRVLVEDARPVNHIPVETILIEQSYLKFV